MLLPGGRSPAGGRRRPSKSQVLAQGLQYGQNQSHARSQARAVSLSPTSSPPAGGATPTAGGAGFLISASAGEDGSGPRMRRSSTASSLVLNPSEKLRPRSKSSGGRQMKVSAATDAVVAEAAAKAAKGSPPKAFRVLPGRFSAEAPPTPRRQTPRAPKRTPRLSPRAFGSGIGGVGNRLQIDQEERRRKRSSANIMAEVTISSHHETALRRSASAQFSDETTGEEPLASACPVIAPPAPSGGSGMGPVAVTCGDSDASANQQAKSLSGTTTPTDGGGETSSVIQVQRRLLVSQAQADSRVMRLIGKRSVLRTSNGAPGPEVAQRHRGKQQRYPQAVPVTAPATPGSTSSSVASPSALEASPKTSGRVLGQAKLKSEGLQASGITGHASECLTEAISSSPSVDRTGNLVASTNSCSFTNPASVTEGTLSKPLHQDTSLAARASALVAEAVADSRVLNGIKDKQSPIDVRAVGSRCQSTQELEEEKEEFREQHSKNETGELKEAMQGEQPLEATAATASVLLEDGSIGAIIWPGASAAAKEADQAKIHHGYPVETGPGTTSATGAVDENTSAKAMVVDCGAIAGGNAAVPWPLLQNEAGSLVVPQTWRYVPPPPDQLPQAPPRPSEPCGVDANAGDCRNSDGATTSDAEDTGDQEDLMPLDADAKQVLVEDLVDFLIARAERCEKELAAEQRANRALRMSLEAEQRKSTVFQQQLAWLAQQAGYQYDGVSISEASAEQMPAEQGSL